MCNFSGMIKNVLPSLRQRAGPQRICSRQKSIRSGTARNSFSQAPHVRGKGCCHHPMILVNGITPACAGKRPAPPAQLPLLKDHPRVCGEKVLPLRFPSLGLGSPPRMRGKGIKQSNCGVRVRITPACAGKSREPARGPASGRDHPRMCGEKFRAYAKIWNEWGSPPRMRGKVPLRPSDDTREWDHPRICGEKCGTASSTSWEKESPPHVRGKALPLVAFKDRPGITPACAGKRDRLTVGQVWGWDHPRMCGEKAAFHRLHLVKLGSPPHVRGKVQQKKISRDGTGDHPRMCGEKSP